MLLRFAHFHLELTTILGKSINLTLVSVFVTSVLHATQKVDFVQSLDFYIALYKVIYLLDPRKREKSYPFL